MEDGQISDHASQRCNRLLRPGDIYDPAYEWPGEPSSITLDTVSSENSPKGTISMSKKRKEKRPSLRLVVLRTSILPSKHKLAIMDGYSELQLGRDAPLAGISTPRIRLKEMEVSKFHATVFWDAQRLEWSIVDMGSKHGTFLTRTHGASTSSDDIRLRLSPPRVTSVPRRLRHLDHLTLGSTTFLIHIHDDQVSCEACSPTGGDEIPLSHAHKASDAGTAKRSRDVAGLAVSSYSQQTERDPKKALIALKHELLSRHGKDAPRSQSPFDNFTQYVDRSARRRALCPASHADSPGVQPTHPPYTRHPSPSTVLELPKPPSEPTSQPPTPLPTSNVGHRLLVKQGWTPGTALGTSELNSGEDRVGLVEPLEVTSTTQRFGLGHAKVRDRFLVGKKEDYTIGGIVQKDKTYF